MSRKDFNMLADEIIKELVGEESMERIAVLDAYCQTDEYKKCYAHFEDKVSSEWNIYKKCRDGIFVNAKCTAEDFEKKADIQVQMLNAESLVHHVLILNKGKDDDALFKTIVSYEIQAQATADVMPFTISDRYVAEEENTMTLKFDLQIGINEQLEEAKKKLQEKQRNKKNLFVEHVATSRRKIQVSCQTGINKCMVFCLEWLNRQFKSMPSLEM